MEDLENTIEIPIEETKKIINEINKEEDLEKTLDLSNIINKIEPEVEKNETVNQ